MSKIICSIVLLFLAFFCVSCYGQEKKNYYCSYDFFLNKGIEIIDKKDCRKHDSHVEVFIKKGDKYISFTDKNKKIKKPITFKINCVEGFTIFTRERHFAGWCYSDSIFLFNEKYFVFTKTIIPCDISSLLTIEQSYKLIKKDYWFFSHMDTLVGVNRLRTTLGNVVEKDISIEDGLPDENSWLGSLDIDSLQVIRGITSPYMDSPASYSAYFNRDLKNKNFVFDFLYWILSEADY